MLKHMPLHYVLGFIFLVLVATIGYGIDRHQTTPLLASYFLLYAIYAFLVRHHDTLSEPQANLWIILAVIFRAALLFSIPALSDDFYRFIWDGRVLAAGHNPYTAVPSFYMRPSHGLPGLNEALFGKLNSKDRFSSYPPVCQGIYWLSVKLSPDSLHGSVLIMKNILFLFEIGSIWVLRRLTAHFQLKESAVLIYALNPLVILEVTGNLHFEGVMIFFLMLAIYLLIKKQLFASSTSFALSICTKLIPLIFLPLLYRTLGWKKAGLYWVLTGVVTFLLFVPLVDQNIYDGFSTSIGYYFQRFEFNASLYYVIRAIGYWIFGYNIIHFAGPALAAIAAIAILYISLKGIKGIMPDRIYPDLFIAMGVCLVIYFVSSAILHPWYIITLLVISIFTPYRFPILWTGLIFLTYSGYSKNYFEENLILVAAEYVCVITYTLYETIWANRRSHS